MRFFIKCFLAWIVAAASMGAAASGVLMTFEDFRPASSTSNGIYKGFWISPSCHLHGGNATSPPFNPAYLGFDADGCGTVFNPDYLGPADAFGRCQGCVYLARTDGGTFNLDSFDDVSSPFSVTSSAGGVRGIQQPTANFHETFSGPEWENLTWIVFQYAGGGEGHGLDNLALTMVPEPSPAVLGGAGLLVMLAWRGVRQGRGPSRPLAGPATR